MIEIAMRPAAMDDATFRNQQRRMEWFRSQTVDWRTPNDTVAAVGTPYFGQRTYELSAVTPCDLTKLKPETLAKLALIKRGMTVRQIAEIIAPNDLVRAFNGGSHAMDEQVFIFQWHDEHTPAVMLDVSVRSPGLDDATVTNEGYFESMRSPGEMRRRADSRLDATVIAVGPPYFGSITFG